MFVFIFSIENLIFEGLCRGKAGCDAIPLLVRQNTIYLRSYLASEKEATNFNIHGIVYLILSFLAETWPAYVYLSIETAKL